jgi:cytochrome P450
MKQEAPHHRHSRRESSDFQSGEHVKISADSHDQSSAPDLADDPYGFFEHMRRTEPVWRGTIMDTSMTPPELRPDEEWTLFDFESVFAAFRDDDVYGSEMYNQTIGLVFGPTILGMHGKQHHDHRSLVSKAFRQSSLERWEPAVIDPICDQLVDEIKNDSRADLVKAITFEFPTRVTAALLGLPQEDLDLFRRLSLDLISIQVDIEAGLTASVELGTYFQEQFDQRRSAMTNDIIGDLVAAEIDGEKLTDEAIISFLRLLLPAGLETTYRSSSNLLLLLLTHPDQLEALQAERDLIPAAIEEALRYETPLVRVPRTTTQDVEIHGIPIPAGAQVNLCIGSANRDETRWADAGAFDIHRPRRAHISFAGGIHNCLGMHLARGAVSSKTSGRNTNVLTPSRPQHHPWNGQTKLRRDPQPSTIFIPRWRHGCRRRKRCRRLAGRR